YNGTTASLHQSITARFYSNELTCDRVQIQPFTEICMSLTIRGSRSVKRISMGLKVQKSAIAYGHCMLAGISRGGRPCFKSQKRRCQYASPHGQLISIPDSSVIFAISAWRAFLDNSSHT